MKTLCPVLEQQVNEFIKFIGDVTKTPLTDENKQALHKSFETLIRTAQNEVLVKIAMYMKDLSK